MFKFKKVKKEMIIPHHIAFIMDGNGRWAKKRLLPRTAGHREGVIALKEVLSYCREIGIKIVSVFAFSTENWKRPKEEVDIILNLVRDLISEDLEKYIKENIKLVHMGSLSGVPEDIIERIKEAENKTKACNGTIFNLGFNYGGRNEIIEAVNKIVKEGSTEITEKDFESYLYTAGQKDPDIVVRTSGEKRVSNFMLWQMAYSEFIFTKTLWPDMNSKEIDKFIIEFNNRNRRFGSV